MTRHSHRLAVTLVLLTLSAALIAGLLLQRWARTGLAELTGIVVDDTGPLAGVRITLESGAAQTLTDARGAFRLPINSFPQRIVASKPGYFNHVALAESAGIHLTLRRLPDADHAGYRWVDPHPGADRFSCGTCHQEIYHEWRGSGHGGGASSRFLDLYHGRDARGGSAGWGLLKEYPDGADVCASCHDPAPLDGPSRRFGGVHCDFCHKVAGAASVEIGLTHGRYGLDLLRPVQGQLVFGPLGDTPRTENSRSPFQRSSRLCASCHEGVVFGVRVYETYSEWLASPAGRAGTQCQDCHMKPTGMMTQIASDGRQRDPGTLANHRFVDGSQRAMLRRALNLTLELDRRPDGVHVTAEVTATGVGHRIPTGLPDRHLELTIEALDSTGQSVPLLTGPILPPFAGSAGQPGVLFAKLLRGWDGQQPVPFWRASPEFDDTRLRPGEPQRVYFVFPGSTARVMGRLIYRRFWPQTMLDKGWPDDAWLVAEVKK